VGGGAWAPEEAAQLSVALALSLADAGPHPIVPDDDFARAIERSLRETVWGEGGDFFWGGGTSYPPRS